MSIAFDVVAGFLRGLSALANTSELGARGVAISRFLALGALAVERREAGRADFEKLAADIDVMVAQGREPTVEELGALRARSDAAHDILQGRGDFTAAETAQLGVARTVRADLRTAAQVNLLEREKARARSAGLPNLSGSSSVPTPGQPGHFQSPTPEQQKADQRAAGFESSQVMGTQNPAPLTADQITRNKDPGHVDSPSAEQRATAAGRLGVPLDQRNTAGTHPSGPDPVQDRQDASVVHADGSTATATQDQRNADRDRVAAERNPANVPPRKR